jgi:hypothetical protein
LKIVDSQIGLGTTRKFYSCRMEQFCKQFSAIGRIGRVFDHNEYSDSIRSNTIVYAAADFAPSLGKHVNEFTQVGLGFGIAEKRLNCEIGQLAESLGLADDFLPLLRREMARRRF